MYLNYANSALLLKSPMYSEHLECTHMGWENMFTTCHVPGKNFFGAYGTGGPIISNGRKVGTRSFGGSGGGGGPYSNRPPPLVAEAVPETWTMHRLQ